MDDGINGKSDVEICIALLSLHLTVNASNVMLLLITRYLFLGYSQNTQIRYGKIMRATKAAQPMLCLLMAIMIKTRNNRI